MIKLLLATMLIGGAALYVNFNGLKFLEKEHPVLGDETKGELISLYSDDPDQFIKIIIEVDDSSDDSTQIAFKKRHNDLFEILKQGAEQGMCKDEANILTAIDSIKIEAKPSFIMFLADLRDCGVKNVIPVDYK